MLCAIVIAACGPPEVTVLAPSSAAPRTTTPTPTVEPSVAALAPGWSALPDPPVTPRYGATAVWANGQLIVVGGRDSAPCPPNADCQLPEDPPFQDGARWDPATNTWSPMAPPPVPIAYARTAVVDDVVYLLTTDGTTPADPRMLAYDPMADRWEELPLPNSNLMGGGLAAGDGAVILFQGSHEGEQGRRDDLAFDLATRSWQALPQDPLGPSFDRDITLVGDLLVLTAIDLTRSPGGADGPARYHAASWSEDTGWRELPAGDVIGYDPEWLAVGDRLVNPTTGGADGGATNNYGRIFPFGGILVPGTGTWSELPPLPQHGDGARIVPGNIGDDHLVVSSTGWALQPESGQWHLVPPLPDGPDESAAVAVGAGRILVVGGVRWDGGVGNILGRAWVWTPPGQG
jgi:hypothetical protein